MGVVVLKELIFNSFYVERVWWSWRNWFLHIYNWLNGLIFTVSKSVVVLKELIFFTISMMEECGGPERTDFFTVNIFGWVWWSWRNWFLTVSTVGRVWWSWKNWIFTISMMEECGGLERTHIYIYIIDSWMDWFFTVSTLRGCGGLERTDFLEFLLLWRLWWFSKNWF